MSPPDALITAPTTHRVDGVDLLRGLAIFFVLMNHVNMRLAHIPYAQSLPQHFTSFLVWNGQRGVQIFFAISGFLITSTALRRWGSLHQISLRGFYLMRFARIAPLLFALLLVLSILHSTHLHNFVVPQKTGGLPRALLAALTFHINVLEAYRGYLPANWVVLWSLSIEEMFYLFFPLLARFLGRGKFLMIILLGFVATGPFARTILAHGNEIWQEYSYLGGMDAIALGCLTALFVTHKKFSRGALIAQAAAGISLLLTVLCFSPELESWGLQRLGLDMTVVAVATCLVIVAASQSQWKAPHIFSPLLNLGQHSYEIYLTHMFVVFAAFAAFVRIGSPMRAVIPLFAISTIAAALLGELIARFYSEPLNRSIRARCS